MRSPPLAFTSILLALALLAGCLAPSPCAAQEVAASDGGSDDGSDIGSLSLVLLGVVVAVIAIVALRADSKKDARAEAAKQPLLAWNNDQVGLTLNSFTQPGAGGQDEPTYVTGLGLRAEF